MKDLIRKEHQYQANITQVWDAISKSEEISQWFIKADFKAEVGYAYTFTHEDTVISGTVLEANPVYRLTYTWIVGDTAVETTVSWKLEENEQGTLVTLEHSGISGYPNDEMITSMFENFSQGWGSCIKKLEEFLNRTTHAKQFK